MIRLKTLTYLVCFLGFFGTLHGADKYTDENRPYEFGFTIDGEQHRHEKKDENGIIMGEFGFITADGVYHVTVYATDEQGRFKILSMKNIRVKPYPTAGASVKKGHSIPFPPSENAPLLQGPSKTVKPESSMSFPPSRNTPVLQGPPKTIKPESKPVEIKKQISSPAKSCSHCSLPTTTTKAPPPQLTDIATVSRDRPVPPQSRITPSTTYQQNGPTANEVTNAEKSFTTSTLEKSNNPPKTSFDQNKQVSPQQHYNSGQNYLQSTYTGNSNIPSSATNSNYPQQNNQYQNIPQTNQYYPTNEVFLNQNGPQDGPSDLQNNPQNRYPQKESILYPNNSERAADFNFNNPQQNAQTSYNAQSGASGQEYTSNIQTSKDTFRNPKQYNDVSAPNFGIAQSQDFGSALASLGSQPISNKPTLLAAQMQIVPKDTNVHHRNPGEEEGLPDGISKEDMTNLLYTFNYTVGFHGHHEEGYVSGAKRGYYFVTGRNGVRTRVDYIADEKGYRPRISHEVLDLSSDEVPKPETEKEEKFGLKGYEFKWLYFPVDERKH